MRVGLQCPDDLLLRRVYSNTHGGRTTRSFVRTGQIELYSHLPVMKQLCDALKDWGFSICGVYLVRQSVEVACSPLDMLELTGPVRILRF